MTTEDVDVRHHRQLDYDDKEQQSRGFRCRRPASGRALEFAWCVISAVTASSAAKST